MKIEVGKFYRTKENSKVLCISNSASQPFSIVFQKSNGDIFRAPSDDKQILSEWRDRREFWINIYWCKRKKEVVCIPHPTLEIAQNSQSNNPSSSLKFQDRIKIILEVEDED